MEGDKARSEAALSSLSVALAFRLEPSLARLGLLWFALAFVLYFFEPFRGFSVSYRVMLGSLLSFRAVFGSPFFYTK